MWHPDLALPVARGLLLTAAIMALVAAAVARGDLPASREEGFAGSSAAASFPSFFVDKDVTFPCSDDGECTSLNSELCEPNYFRCGDTCVAPGVTTGGYDDARMYEEWPALARRVPLKYLLASDPSKAYAVGVEVRVFDDEEDAFVRARVLSKTRLARDDNTAYLDRTLIYDVEMAHSEATAARATGKRMVDVPHTDLFVHKQTYRRGNFVKLWHQPSGLWVDGVVVERDDEDAVACGGGGGGGPRLDVIVRPATYTVRYNAQDLSGTRRFRKQKRVEAGFAALD